MDLIVSTDLGNDPDDFFTLCYLAAVWVNIRLIDITPGNGDQVAIARWFLHEIGRDALICGSNPDPDRLSSGGIHHQLLRRHDWFLKENVDGPADFLLKKTIEEFPRAEILIIGPPKTIGRYFRDNPTSHLSRATMQGGFLAYNLHTFPCQRLEKFVGCDTMATFNMGGAPKETEYFCGADIGERQFVGKNVCHTIIFNQQKFDQLSKPQCRAAELFVEGMKLYLNKHEEKKFHDPLAAFLHLRPDCGSWVIGKPYREKGKWGTRLCEGGDKVLAAVDEEKFWEGILNWNHEQNELNVDDSFK